MYGISPLLLWGTAAGRLLGIILCLIEWSVSSEFQCCMDHLYRLILKWSFLILICVCSFCLLHSCYKAVVTSSEYCTGSASYSMYFITSIQIVRRHSLFWTSDRLLYDMLVPVTGEAGRNRARNNKLHLLYLPHYSAVTLRLTVYAYAAPTVLIKSSRHIGHILCIQHKAFIP